MTATRATLIDLSPYAEAVHEHIVEVSNNVQDVQIDTGRVYRFANSVLEAVQHVLIMAQVVVTNAIQIAVQHVGNFSSEIEEAMEVFNDVQRINSEAQKALGLVQMQLKQSQNLTSDYQSLNDSLEMLMLQINDLTLRKDDLKMRLANTTMTTDRLKLNIPQIEFTIRYATKVLVSAEQTIRKAEYALIMVMEDVQTLTELVGDNLKVSTYMSGDRNTLFSGSGVSELESYQPTSEPVPDTIVGRVELLRRTVLTLEQMYIGGAGVRQQAMDHARNVSILASVILRYIIVLL